MSAKERLDERIRALRTMKFTEQGGVCPVCGDPLMASAQLAHRIPQRKWCLDFYGKSIIHHSMNMVLVCSLECNAKVQIKPKSQQALALTYAIRREIKEGRE